MAICPFAKQELIPAGSSDPKIDAVGLVAHIAVSMSDDIHDFFDGPSGGIESHFYIQFDGDILQYRDTAYEADAQAAGNSWLDAGGIRKGMISVETQGMGDGQWTTAQLLALKKLISWANVAHKNFKAIPATAWNSGGIGYHAQFEKWNPNRHSCPGPNRIPQIKNVIWPWLSSLHPSVEKISSLKILRPALMRAKGRRRKVLKKIKDLWGTIK